MSNVEQKTKFHAPLHPLDTQTKTYDCRHTNPSICANHSMPGKCAFVRGDKLCLRPPTSWPKQYEKLKASAGRKKIA
jgi:predicted nucleic acid binding AN1-type Zn finger protein